MLGVVNGCGLAIDGDGLSFTVEQCAGESQVGGVENEPGEDVAGDVCGEPKPIVGVNQLGRRTLSARRLQTEQSRLRIGLRDELLVQTSVDAASGSDSKYEDDKSIVAYVVDDAVAADADAPPPGRAGQRHRTGRPRLGAESCDRLDDPPADGRVKLADLLAG